MAEDENDALIEEINSQAAADSEELILSIEKWLPVREKTISHLMNIADELVKLEKDVTISKVTGTSVAIAGGVMAVAGTVGSFFTFGLAAPLALAGAAMAAGGGMTSVFADITKLFKEKSQFKNVNEEIRKDGEIFEKISEIYKRLSDIIEKLKQISEGISQSDLKSALHTGPYLLLSSFLGPVASILGYEAGQAGLDVRKGALVGGKVGAQGGKATTVAGKAAAQVGRAAASGVLAVPLVAFDIGQLVTTSVEMSNGSKSEAAKLIRREAENLRESKEEMQVLVKDLRKMQEEVISKVRLVELDKLLCILAKQDAVSREDAEKVNNLIQQYADSSWKKVYNEQTLEEKLDMCSKMAGAYSQIASSLEKEKNPGEVKDIVLLAHGSIQSPLIPPWLYFPTDSLMDITLYQPWGCSIDAFVAHGIITGTISLSDRQFFNGYGEHVNLDNLPVDWNTVDKHNLSHCLAHTFSPMQGDQISTEMIPIIMLEPVNETDGAFIHLLSIFTLCLKSNPKRIVIPIFRNTLGNMKGVLPLWAYSTMVALYGRVTNNYYHLHIAACLTCTDDKLINPYTEFIKCEQYASVRPRDHIVMRRINPGNIPQEFQDAVARIL